MFSALGKALDYILNANKVDEPEECADSVEQKTEEPTKYKRELEGKVSHIFSSHGLINSEIYFSFENVVGGAKPKVGDCVSVVAHRENAEGGWHAVQVMISENWDENETQLERNENGNNVGTHEEESVGYVTHSYGTTGYINNNIFYNLNDCDNDNFIPHKGDWVKVQVTISPDSATSQKAFALEPLRVNETEGVITGEMGDHGYIDEEVFYMREAMEDAYIPRKWDPVHYVAVESFQGRCSWRAIKIEPSKQAQATRLKLIQGPLQKSFTEELLSNKEGITITEETDFGLVTKGTEKSLTLWIKNIGNQPKTFCRCHLAASSTQLKIKDVKMIKDQQSTTNVNNKDDKIDGNIVLYPNMMIYVTVGILANTEGNEKQLMVFTFDGFKIGRYLTATVKDLHVDTSQYKNTYVSNQRQGYNRYRKTQEIVANSWMVPGQRPNRSKRTTQFPNRLPKYEVPDNIREATLYPDSLTEEIPVLSQDLTFENYSEKFKNLLYLEEIQMDIDIREFDISRVCLRRVGEYLSLSVPGLAEGRPSVLIGDKVILTDPGDPDGPSYEGYVHEILRDEVLLKFNPEFHTRYTGQDYDVIFTFNRGPLRKCHKAVELAKQLGEKILFPKYFSPKPLKNTHHSLKACSSSENFFFNKRLNSRQKAAVVRILQGQGRPLPYILFGPPGTGKTVTVVEAILQVLKKMPYSRIIACTPSNSAADLLTVRLHESGQVTKTDMVRLNASQRDSESIPESILPYCKIGDDLDIACRMRILISTCVSVGTLYSLGIRMGHFSHVFIDEAGQATEPEAMISACLLSGTDGQLILAGDPQQLGPVLMSKHSKQYGLELSFLERLIHLPLYTRNESQFADHGSYDPYLVTKLVDNYRCHPSILSLPSRLFYHNELVVKADIGLTHTCIKWKKLPTVFVPVIFHGIRGEDMREGNSPSWFNPMEAVQLVTYIQSILNSEEINITPDDIGVITPYRKQVEHIRLFIEKLGIGSIKVGSVEEFQGQERQVIIISTVRASEDRIGFDVRHCLGFLSNPKRFNVSITRAQALLIVVGNPYILIQDSYWKALVEYCIEIGAYTGCDPPPTEINL